MKIERKAGSFKVRKRKVIFSKGPIHLVDCDVRVPSGRVVSRQIIEHPGSVVMIPLISRNRIILIKQFRFAAECDLWELPAGGIEKGETLRKAASRELTEEIGYRPGRLKKLLSFYPSPGISGEVMHLFRAEALKPASAVGDEDEEIECAEFSLREVDEMIQRRKIIDAKTILAYYHLIAGRKNSGRGKSAG